MAKKMQIRNLETGAEHEAGYDTRFPSPGAAPLGPPIPGFDLAVK